MLSDPIADMLTRIRNGYMVKKQSVLVQGSKLNEQILSVLSKNGFIGTYQKALANNKKKTAGYQISVNLVYPDGKSAISHIARVSKPGRKAYIKAKKLKPILSGYGIQIVTTPQGIMTNTEAKKKNTGGELLCEVW